MSEYKRFKLDPTVPVSMWPGYQYMKIDKRHCIVDFMGKDKVIWYPESDEMMLYTEPLDPGDVIESNFRGALATYAGKHLPIDGHSGLVPSLQGYELYLDGYWVFTIKNCSCNCGIQTASYVAKDGRKISVDFSGETPEVSVPFRGVLREDSFDTLLEEKMLAFDHTRKRASQSVYTARLRSSP